jgi:hypothetical protein
VKYLVTFNVMDRKSGRPTPLKVSCEFKDLPREAAVKAMLQYASQQGILIGGVPSSIESVGARPRKDRLTLTYGKRTPKVRTPSL